MKEPKQRYGQSEKWDGVLTIKFLRKVANVFYYDVSIDFKGKRVRITLPRYAPMIGWIEVFGLPPQNEWVTLDSTSELKESGTLTVVANNQRKRIKESVEVHTNKKAKWRVVKLERTLGSLFENQFCFESWEHFRTTRQLKKHMLFEHSFGSYSVTLTSTKNPDVTLLTSQQRNYLRRITAERGKPTEVWLKTFVAAGDPLPIYYQIFPFWTTFWKNGTGSAIEIGYEKEMNHGDWYKLFTLGSKKFEIKEDGWGAKKIQHKGKTIRIKDTYRKVIREVS